MLSSLLAVYTSIGSMAYVTHGGNTEYFLAQQVTFVALGFAFIYLFYRADYRRIAKIAPYFLVFALIALVYTLSFGYEINQAKRWIMIPWIDKTIQTSDFAKLALFIYLARSIATNQHTIKDIKSAWKPLFIPILLVCGLIAPNNLSTAAIVFMTSLLMLFIGRISLKFIFMLGLATSIGATIIVLLGVVFPNHIRLETWISRITKFLAQDDSTFQVVQAKIAIAQGGFTGVGPGNSLQKNYLPEAWSDCIYAIICEEYGLIGGLFIMAMYIWLLIRCVKIVVKSPKAFGAILAMGLCLDIVINAFANICVSVQLLPATGLTLPLVSMGGTSLLLTSISLGLILSVSRVVEGFENPDIDSPTKVAHEGTN